MSALASQAALRPSRTQRLRAAAREAWTHPELRVLAAALVLGLLIRIALVATYRPAFLGYPDSGAYLYDAFGPNAPFRDPLRVVGYGEVLRILHDLTAHLGFVVLLQHLLGLATAVSWYLILRGLGVRSRWVAIAPAVVVALGGAEILFEHAILTESLWLGLMSFAFLALVRAAQPGRSGRALVLLAALAGVLVGLSMCVRLTGIFAAPVMAVWLLVVAGGGGVGVAAGGGAAGPRRPTWPKRALAAVALVAALAAPILGFSQWQQSRTDRFGLTRNGVLNIYGRVGPWADCTKFTPPKGTEFLCETSKISTRRGHEYYTFGPSPATKHYTVGQLKLVLSPEGSKAISSWSKAAILGQPFTYLKAVARESRRIIDPDAAPGMPGQPVDGYGLGPMNYHPLLISKAPDVGVLPIVAANYGEHAAELHRGDVIWFMRYETASRFHPIEMALLIALALMAPFVTRGPERRAAWLLMPTAVLLLVMPVAVSIYEWRYIPPTLGFLVGAAAIGAWGVVLSARGAWAQRQARRSAAA
jgi:hypothetical protein